MNSNSFANQSRTAGDTVEHVIYGGPCVLYGIYPELTTTGTITIRDSLTAAGAGTTHVCAIGLLQSGKNFGPKGIRFDKGLTVQLSAATDLTLIAWEPI